MKYDSNRIPGYWEWKNLTINGTVGNITINASSNGNMDIHPNGPGFTRNQLSDISCERKYSSCAPLQLSWSCDNQEFSSLGTVNETVKITFPGLQLQPFFNSGNGNGVKAIRYCIISQRMIHQLFILTLCNSFTYMIINFYFSGLVLSGPATHYLVFQY